MLDLIERLRSRPDADCIEAAHQIERLRTALESFVVNCSSDSTTTITVFSDDIRRARTVLRR